MEMCRATDFGFSVIALLIKSREAPILRRGIYSRRSSLLGERAKVNFYRARIIGMRRRNWNSCEFLSRICPEDR